MGPEIDIYLTLVIIYF